MTSKAGHPFISIVTPSLNQAQYLGEAMESVRQQRYPRHEHLVLDGGYTDGSAVLLKRASHASIGSQLWRRSGSDGGQSAALNEGFARASGDIIGWLNADDRYRPGCFEKVANTFALYPEIDVLCGDYTLIDAAGKHPAMRREIDFNHFVLRYHRVLYIPTTADFFRRRIFDDGHFLTNSLQYAMDLDFFLRLADAGYQFRCLARVLADFRIHTASKSIEFIDRQRAEHRSIILRETPLAQRFQSMRVRSAAATLLQVPALMRYGEKLLRGFYLPYEIPEEMMHARERRQL